MSEENSQKNCASPRRKDIVEHLETLLGKDAVLLAIEPGQKRPLYRNWPRTPAGKATEPEFNWRLRDGNIGVLLGEPSNGLCSIDMDSDEFVDEFLKLNPTLHSSLRSCGKRGGNIWVRIRGEYPPLTKLEFRDRRTEDGKPVQWGEWRSTGGQTVIHGKHPDGPKYRITHEAPPAEIAFESIVWPTGLVLPWQLALYEQLVRDHGAPFTCGKRAIVPNDYFFVAKFAAEHQVLFEPNEQQFYLYDEERGLWRVVTDNWIKNQFAIDLKAYGDTQHEPHFETMRKTALLNSLADMLRGLVEKPDAFERRPGIIHLANGMLDLNCDPPELKSFSPDFYSRNQCPILLDENADCPRFREQLLQHALPDEDIWLLQRSLGAALLGGNKAQKILLLTGTSGGGKSTIVEIAEKIIGLENVTEIRTEQLAQRFEIARFSGKRLLTGKDVPADFMSRASAAYLKKLTGNDFLTGERKGSNECINVRGNFDVIITANSRLRVYLEGDAEAWRRRLNIIEFTRPEPKNKIFGFADILIADEGPGILNFMIAGALAHLEEIKAGKFLVTETQKKRVERLLADSDTVRGFVSECLKAGRGEITVDDMHVAYTQYCDELGLQAKALRPFHREARPLIQAAFGVTERHDVKSDEGGAKRGYKGIIFNP